ncbi:uncharacterized protein LOC119397544 [Rhipicephalus sanguineus]|uniref:uncharacterized protein LOC119397544 n=1 Tax=Rhipicephalus sanguineus TaxID=34632 RepID=UPI0018944E07|nr:uncharacterized protein LOC119397544 [Rhipicephalus sanguineus]
MCRISSREAIGVAAACLLINAFNVAYVLKPEIERHLRKQSWFVYVPDVHDVSKLVGVETSNYIALGLAGISIIFDAFILVGTVQYIPELLDSGCIWHYVDLGADIIVGMASANYTRPQVVVHKTKVAKAPTHRSGCAGVGLCTETPSALNATDIVEDDGRMPHGANDSNHRTASTEREDDQALLVKERSVHPRAAVHLFRAGATEHMSQTKEEKTSLTVLTEPATVRQFLHFSYVIMRAAVKFQKLGMLGSLSVVQCKESH